jgi:hypothetical protein
MKRIGEPAYRQCQFLILAFNSISPIRSSKGNNSCSSECARGCALTLLCFRQVVSSADFLIPIRVATKTRRSSSSHSWQYSRGDNLLCDKLLSKRDPSEECAGFATEPSEYERERTLGVTLQRVWLTNMEWDSGISIQY